MAMQERLRKFLTQEGITPSQFADEIGVQRSAISHILSGRNYPGYEVIVKILSRYKRLNPDWLLLGTGSMYRSADSSASASASASESASRSTHDSSSSQQPQNMIHSADTQSPENHAVGTNLQMLTSVNSRVDRIVIFYTDKTFEIYLPRN